MIKIEKITNLTEAELLILFDSFEAKWLRLVKPYSFEKFCKLYNSLTSREEYYRVVWDNQLAGVFSLSGNFSETKPIKGIKKQYSNWRWYIGAELLSDKVTKTECYISCLAISQEFRSKGLGKACLDYIEERAIKREAVTSVTLFVAKDNKQAVKLYQREGFLITGQVNSLLTSYFLGEGSWFKMKKELLN